MKQGKAEDLIQDTNSGNKPSWAQDLLIFSRTMAVPLGKFILPGSMPTLASRWAVSWEYYAPSYTETSGDCSLLFARLTQVFLNYKMCCSLGPSWITPFIMAVLCSVMSVVHQARILEWLAISFSRGSSSPRDWTPTSPALEGCSLPQANSLPLVPPGKPHFYYILNINRIIPTKSKMSVETDTQRLLPVK